MGGAFPDHPPQLSFATCKTQITIQIKSEGLDYAVATNSLSNSSITNGINKLLAFMVIFIYPCMSWGLSEIAVLLFIFITLTIDFFSESFEAANRVDF